MLCFAKNSNTDYMNQVLSSLGSLQWYPRSTASLLFIATGALDFTLETSVLNLGLVL
jgi:hypothetical protein